MDICNDIIWYNSVNIINSNYYNKEFKELPGYQNYINYHNLFAFNLSLTDRYQSIQLPIKTKILPISEPVQFRKFTKTYEEICIDRAKELLDYAKEHNKKIFIMYSGGIDSTAIICSFLAISTDEELKKYIIVGLSENSIIENKNFYYDFLLKKFSLVSSDYFQNYLCNDNYIFISGENNDQIFGSDILSFFINLFGFKIISHNITDEIIIKCIDKKINNILISEKITSILNKVIKSAPFKIETVFEYFWWVNFSLKWQNVYLRLLSYSKYPIKLEENYTTFFATEDFQLWSLNNRDNKIKNTWESYKYPCKDFIYSINKDSDYRNNKLKKQSGGSVVWTRNSCNFIDSNFNKHNEPILLENWNHDNNFI